MDSKFFGVSFINADGSAADSGAVYSKKAIAVYFSAHWCPPCRGFTPVLTEFYNDVQSKHPDALEIIFATSDQDNEKFLDYFKSMPWKAIKFGDAKINELKSHFGVSGIPCLVVCKPDGTLITKNGRGDVSQQGAACVEAWTK